MAVLYGTGDSNEYISDAAKAAFFMHSSGAVGKIALVPILDHRRS